MRFVALLILFLVVFCFHEIQCGNETETEPKNNTDRGNDSAVKESKRQRESVVKETIRAGSSEACDILKNPMGVIRGESCGLHYKVLGINRKKSPVDKSTVRKAYHKLSLSTHPDKNGGNGKDAEAAFNLVQSAYDCLSDPDCQREYNYKLDSIEEDTQYRRRMIKERVTEEVKAAANAIREGAVSVASFVVKVAEDVAHRLEWKVNILDRTVDAGNFIASCLLFIFCRPVAYSLFLSHGILFLNNLLEDRWPQFRRFGSSNNNYSRYFD